MRAFALFGAGTLGGTALGFCRTVQPESGAVRVDAAGAASKKCAFDPNEYKPFKLLNTRFESQDTRRFYFALDTKESTMNIPIASAIVVKYVDAEGKDVVRPYTPVSTNETKGYFELMVKRYPKSKMGTHFFHLKDGETILVKGPFEKIKITTNKYKHLGMIAGGTGITPMYQVIRAVLDNPKDKTHLSLIYANNARKDILLANELLSLNKAFSNFDLYLTLLDVPKKWLGGVGYLNVDMIKTFMPKPGEKDTMILVCGPPGMMKAVSGDKEFPEGKLPQQGPLSGLLKEAGYTENQVFKF